MKKRFLAMALSGMLAFSALAVQPVQAPLLVEFIAGFVIIPAHAHGRIGGTLGQIRSLVHADRLRN